MHNLSISNKKGAVLVLVAVLIFALIGMVALALDVYHLYVVKNELQNSADAGALGGAPFLFEYNAPDEILITEKANERAKTTAQKNLSEKIQVEVDWSSGNGPDVVRGHYNPLTQKFKAKNNDKQTSLTYEDGTYIPKEILYENENLINAIKVTTWRGKNLDDPDKRAHSFFAKVFGYKSFGVKAEAVAFLDFAGGPLAGEIDLPIAICLSAILDPISGDYDCGQARLINSASKADSNNAGFTNYLSCDTNFNPAIFKPSGDDGLDSKACQLRNPNTLENAISLGGGEVDWLIGDIKSCMEDRPDPTTPWTVTLPVVDCEGQSNPSGCFNVVSSVNMKIVLITDQFPEAIDNPNHFKDLPAQIGDEETGIWKKNTIWDEETETWKDATLSGLENWKSFVDFFELKIRYNKESLPAYDPVFDKNGYYQKTIYALPTCEKGFIKAAPNGENLGLLTNYPVLVPFDEEN